MGTFDVDPLCLADQAECYAIEVFDGRRTFAECVIEWNALHGASKQTLELVRQMRAILGRWRA